MRRSETCSSQATRHVYQSSVDRSCDTSASQVDAQSLCMAQWRSLHTWHALQTHHLTHTHSRHHCLSRSVQRTSLACSLTAARLATTHLQLKTNKENKQLFRLAVYFVRLNWLRSALERTLNSHINSFNIGHFFTRVLPEFLWSSQQFPRDALLEAISDSPRCQEQSNARRPLSSHRVMAASIIQTSSSTIAE